MSIINILLEFGVVLLCAFIQLIGVVVQGVVRILARVVQLLEKAHRSVSRWRPKQKRVNKTRVNVPL
jgi:hypothetical protein